MFRRKPNLKALAPLRSSDRRKLVDVIIRQYGIKTSPAPDQGTESADANLLAAVRNDILPEKNTLSASFVVKSGLDERIAKGTIYVGAYHEEPLRVLWIKLDDDIVIPSIYTLWRRPRLIPLLHTPSLVIDKMREGADLNTPGLVGPPFPAAAKKGSIVAVASIESPSVPMVVGVCEIDISDLLEVDGRKGHAVRPLHCQGDELWNWNLSGQGGEPSPESIDAWLQTDDQNNTNIREQDGTALEARATDQPRSPENVENRPDQNDLQTGPLECSESRDWTIQEVDLAFHNAFLYGIYHAVQRNPEPAHGIQFPMSQSQLVSTMISPYLPIFSQDDAAALQMKRTSWKTVKKFIKSLDKAQLLKSKDRNGGETVVLDIDFTDQAVTTFQPYRLPKKKLPDTRSDGAAISGSGSRAEPVGGHRLQRLVLLRPKDTLSPIFTKQTSHGLYLPSEIKSAATKYIEDEALVDPLNKRFVNLNSFLVGTIFSTNNSSDSEILAKGFIPRDHLLDRVLEICSPFFLVLKNGELRDDAKAKPGKAPSVKVSLESRSGNKTVTRLSGLEVFGINPHLLAEDLQKTCASSTTVSSLVGSSARSPQLEVMVQGPQRDAVLKFLDNMGVKRDWIEVTDKTRGKKK